MLMAELLSRTLQALLEAVFKANSAHRPVSDVRALVSQSGDTMSRVAEVAYE